MFRRHRPQLVQPQGSLSQRARSVHSFFVAAKSKAFRGMSSDVQLLLPFEKMLVRWPFRYFWDVVFAEGNTRRL